MENAESRTYETCDPREIELVREAWEIQTACNLAAVVNSWSRCIKQLRTIADERGGKGTEWINRHPACQLYADKVTSLTHNEGLATMHRIAETFDLK